MSFRIFFAIDSERFGILAAFSNCSQPKGRLPLSACRWQNATGRLNNSAMTYQRSLYRDCTIARVSRLRKDAMADPLHLPSAVLAREIHLIGWFCVNAHYGSVCQISSRKMTYGLIRLRSPKRVMRIAAPSVPAVSERPGPSDQMHDSGG